jgi:hypothetical protein
LSDKTKSWTPAFAGVTTCSGFPAFNLLCICCRPTGARQAAALDKKDSILENTYTLIDLPPYLVGQRSSTSPQGGNFKRGYLNRAFFLPAGMQVHREVQGGTRAMRVQFQTAESLRPGAHFLLQNLYLAGYFCNIPAL